MHECLEQPHDHAIFVCVLNFPLCLTALSGNSAILITIWKTPSLHSPANILLASLAVTDFAVGIIAQPLLISFLLNGIYGSLYRYYINCLVFNLVAYYLCGVSFTTITAIGVDRFLALQLHLRYNSIITNYRAKLVVIGIWIWAGLCSLLWLQKSNNTSVVVIIGFALLVANFFIYCKIYLIVRRHQVQIQDQQPQVSNGTNFRVKRLISSTFNTFLVLILLICCYLPQFSVLIIGHKASLIFYFTSVTIALLNSSLNPILYCWRVREFRSAAKSKNSTSSKTEL